MRYYQLRSLRKFLTHTVGRKDFYFVAFFLVTRGLVTSNAQKRGGAWYVKRNGKVV